jgi:hypothetical protein
VNLFTRIEPNSTRLRFIPLNELNGPKADATISQIGHDIDGPAIAGWGNLPTGLRRSRYDARVGDVRDLLGMNLVCLASPKPVTHATGAAGDTTTQRSP